MGLPARQLKVLDRIETTLRGSDPRLASLYAIFTRLTRDEEMPRIEQLRYNAVRVMTRLRLMLAAISRRRVITRTALYRNCSILGISSSRVSLVKMA